MKFELSTDVTLRCDVPEHRLRRGDIVKLVDHHMAPDGTEGYSIEVFNALGDTIAVTSVPASALEALPPRRSALRPHPITGRSSISFHHRMCFRWEAKNAFEVEVMDDHEESGDSRATRI